MVLAFAVEGEARGGVREIDPGRDLGVVAGLIAQGFAGDLDSRAQAALREMRRMARLWPLVGWLAEADPILRESLSGFVWEEPVPGKNRLQVVANVSLNAAPGTRGWSVLCNVVTRPDYRRQGIARRLTLAAIDAARERGAQGILLQVHSSNQAARHLYSDIGFREVAGETDLRLEKPQDKPVQGNQAAAIRRMRRSDGRAAFDLARREIPEPLQWLSPVRQAEYQPDLLAVVERWIAELLAGRRTVRLVACQAGRLAGLLTLVVARRGPCHRLSLLAGAEDRGQVEGALLGAALRLLAAEPPAPVWATVFQDHAEAIRALQGLGFEEQRTLLLMQKVLR